MYVVRGQYASIEQKRARQNELNMNPPKPGSILVTDPSEDWGILSANLDAFDSSVDGMAIKTMVAVNHVPMHYLAEGEGSTRTTSDAAGTPTFKGFENQQAIFKKIILAILKIAVARRAEKDSTVKADAEIVVTSADATERDNAGLALATSQMVGAIGDMFDRELIDSEEYIRLVYRFAGETVPEGAEKVKGIRKPVNKPAPSNNNGSAGNIKVDSASGAIKIKEPQ
jgi:hypothetical protein